MDQLSINSQWKAFLRHCAVHAKEGIVAELDYGVTICWNRSNLSLLNGAFLSTPVTDEMDLHRRLEAIKAYSKKIKPTFPWAFFIEPELLPPSVRERSQEICLKGEFVHASNITAMQTTKLLPAVRPLPSVEIKFVSSQEDIYDAALLNVQASNMDSSVAQSIVEQQALVTDYNRELCCIVGVAGQPVSTATTLLLSECLYVAYVATSAEHRQHGYAEVALRASIERALESVPETKLGIVLHATKLGRPVYARMGFKDISHVEMYVYKPTTSTSDES